VSANERARVDSSANALCGTGRGRASRSWSRGRARSAAPTARSRRGRAHDAGDRARVGGPPVLLRDHEVNVHLFGGEPLERMDLLRLAIDLAERRGAESGKRVTYSLPATACSSTKGISRPSGWTPRHPFQHRWLPSRAEAPLAARPFASQGPPQGPPPPRDAQCRRGPLLRGIPVDPDDIEGLRADVDAMGDAGVEWLIVFFRHGIEWPEPAADSFLREMASLLRARAGRGCATGSSRWIRSSSTTTSSWTAMGASTGGRYLLERAFPEIKRACRIGQVGRVGPSVRSRISR